MPLRLRLIIAGLLMAARSTAFAQSANAPYGLEKRVAWTTSKVVGTPEPPPPYTVEKAFPNLKFKNPVYIAQEPGTNRFMVGELSGKIYAFTRETPNNEARELFLDIGREMYSFSFHPQYAENGHLFTFSPRDPKDKRKPAERLSRVSRWTANNESPQRGLQNSELVIVEWPAGGHNGGEAIIGPDGYLYISTGDSTSGSDPKSTGQGVNDLLSVMMRIDVSKAKPGKPYTIPADNPFVNYPGARPEIWAFGFRNPWRFSFDAKTKELWVGDVGQDIWEMIWIVQRGGNYGWSVQEGSRPFHPHKPVGPGPILPAVVEHHHSVCRSITGGYVYYGAKFPELKGTYFYGDYEYGMVWGLRTKDGKADWNEVLANTSLRIASFGLSRDGDILLVDHPSGEIYQLAKAERRQTRQRFPRLLSQTGLFRDVASHNMADGIIPYSVNTPQWLDGANMDRFMAIPDKGQIKFVERSGNANTWGFPDGTVNVQTISLEMEAGKPDSRRRLETRILVKQENHWLGYSYLWNAEQTDAELVSARGRELKLQIKDKRTPTGSRQQRWLIPSRNECMVCHSRAAGFSLGLRTPQMNRTHQYGDVADNQLRAFRHIGLFSNPPTKKLDDYDAFPSPYDPSADLNERARAYLHVNCSVCHVADGGGNAKIELKYHQSFEQTKLDALPMHGTFGLENARLVQPGDPYASVLLFRLTKWGQGRMPHVGSNRHDERGLRLIEEWITDLPPRKDAVVVKPTTASILKMLQQAEKKPTAQQQETARQLLGSSRSAFIAARLIARNSDLPQMRQQLIQQALPQPEAQIRDLFERFLPPDQRVKRLGNSINMEDILELSGDVAAGKRLFASNSTSQCRNCHRLGKQGESLGPELSSVGKRLKRNEILESLVYPSRKIEDKYRSFALATDDGKIHTGILVSKTKKQVVLKTLRAGKPATLTFAADSIERLAPQQKSLMPDGLLRNLTAQQAADLVAYLKSLSK